MNHRLLISIAPLTLCLLSLSPLPSYAASPQKLDGFQPDLCTSTPMQICGVQFMIQPGTLGTIQTVTLPSRFQNRYASVQCISSRGRFYYRLADGANCALKTCEPGNVSLCNVAIPVASRMQIGDTVKVSIPTDLLNKEHAGSAPAFTARCIIDGETPEYKVDNAANISCNTFACKPNALEVCGSKVEITESAKLGTVMNLKTQSNIPVTVQCLASGGNAPVFTVTDHGCR